MSKKLKTAALAGLRAEARRSGAAKMTFDEINELIADTRRDAKRKKAAKAESAPE